MPAVAYRSMTKCSKMAPDCVASHCHYRAISITLVIKCSHLAFSLLNTADVVGRHTHSPLDSAAAVAAAARPRYGRLRLILLIDDFHFCPAVLFRHWRTRKGTELAPYAAACPR